MNTLPLRLSFPLPSATDRPRLKMDFHFFDFPENFLLLWRQTPRYTSGDNPGIKLRCVAPYVTHSETLKLHLFCSGGQTPSCTSHFYTRVKKETLKATLKTLKTLFISSSQKKLKLKSSGSVESQMFKTAFC